MRKLRKHYNVIVRVDPSLTGTVHHYFYVVYVRDFQEFGKVNNAFAALFRCLAEADPGRPASVASWAVRERIKNGPAAAFSHQSGRSLPAGTTSERSNRDAFDDALLIVRALDYTSDN
jgi:hypothetical protein